jgi:thymidylate kinase
MEALRDLVEKPGDRIRPLFYALGNALCSRSAENILKKSPVVIDRYVYTTIAWHHAMGIDGHLPWGDLDLLQPDVAFLLTVEERSRHNRLHSRSEGLSTRDVRSLTGEAFVRQAYLENLRSYDFVEIDTSSLEPDHVVERMLQHIPVERRLNLFE